MIKKLAALLAIAGLIFNNTGFILALEADGGTPTATVTPSEQEELTESPTPLPTEIVEPTPSQPEVTEALQTEEMEIVEPTVTIEEEPLSEEIIEENSVGNVTVVETGDAISWVNLINLINSNIVNSNLKFLVIDRFYGDIADLDLNSVWKDMGVNGGENFLVIDNKNTAQVDNNVTVVADSGNNQIENKSGEALIVTGDSSALANVINLVNNSFINTEFFVAIINIDGSLLGDIILPKPAKANPTDNSTNQNNNNSATITDNVTVSANSGQNEATVSTEGSISTGDAIAITNSQTYANTASSGGFYLSLNTLGEWDGKIYNFSSPGAVEEATSNNLFFAVGVNPSGEQNQFLGNENDAIVNNVLMVEANSGINTIDAQSGEIKTGKAMAVANLTNFINMNFWGGKWFYGIINVVGDWKGNAIFAYPDLSVKIDSASDNIKEDEIIEYLVDYSNIGWEGVMSAELEITLDNQAEYQDDTSGLGVIRKDRKIIWQIGKLGPKQNKTFVVRAKVSLTDGMASRGLVGDVFAAEPGRIIESKARIKTNEVESDTNNNESVAFTDIIMANIGGDDSEGENQNNYHQDNNESLGEDLLPKIEISVKNNVADFVFPKDIVTFEVEVKNVSDRKGVDSYLVHEISDSQSNLLLSEELYIGEIGPNKQGKIDFGIPMNIDVYSPEKLKSNTRIITFSEKGNKSTSNQSETSWEVRPRGTMALKKRGIVMAKDEGEVLAAGEWSYPATNKVEDLRIYMILFIGSSLYLLKRISDGVSLLKKRDVLGN